MPKPIWTSILLMGICALPCCQTAQNASSLNRSALYDPPMVSLKKGAVYHFVEGELIGTGQFFHSDYSYQQAFLLGLKGLKN